MDANSNTLTSVIGGLAPEASYRDTLKAARKLRAAIRELSNSSPNPIAGNAAQTAPVADASSRGLTTPNLPGMTTARVALVGNSTLSFAGDPLTAHLATRGIQAALQIGQYNGYTSELMDPESEILAARPDFLLIHLNHHAVTETPGIHHSPAECLVLAERQVSFWQQLWQAAHQATGCTIVQTNLAIPLERPFGTCESNQPFGQIHFFRTINRLLVERAPQYVTICDAEQLSAAIGKRHWFDLPHWYASRQPVHFDALAQLADAFAAIVAAKLGRSKKCLVLDLDNTLWGGVLGDVGQENLRLQRGDSVGEAHLDLQAYCRKLKERGVLLAVCSKNEESLARQVFATHPDMILKLADISAFIANWDDKATNLRRIAAQLNIGLDSLVFVDDHPAERELIRQVLPMVSVPEIPEDPAEYVRVLDRYAYFETSEISAEDIARAAQYNAQQARDQAETSFADLHEFLVSLQQSCAVRQVDDQSLPRVVQLLNKTNQFNLTTRRHTAGEIEARLTDPKSLMLSVRHQDRFGDNGLIAVVLGRTLDSELVIEDWVMSCRVFKRGIEDCLFSVLVGAAQARGCSAIRGTYRPNERNRVVANLFSRYGLQQVPVDSSQADEQVWYLSSLEQAILPSHTIRCESDFPLIDSAAQPCIVNSPLPLNAEPYHESRVA